MSCSVDVVVQRLVLILFIFGRLLDSLNRINHRLDEQAATIAAVKQSLDRLSFAERRAATSGEPPYAIVRLMTQYKPLVCVVLGILLQSLLSSLFANRA